MSRASTAPTPRRWPLWVALVIGVGLALAPVGFQMFSRAPRGATMLADFAPFMTTQRLDGFHADLADIDAGVRELSTVPAAKTSDSYQPLAQQWPQIHATMGGLLDTVSDNLPNYQAVAALPSFRLFPWFFLIPGVLIAGAAGVGLARPGTGRPARVALAVLGVGLVAAPFAFSMFSRAPKGGDMMDAFAGLETTAKVEQIQGYFAVIAAGQGAIRLEVLPSVARTEKLTATEVAARYPKATALDQRWIAILNDLTPMIGAMSDNVGNYQAIRALPPFPLFPWFFVAPGVLVIALAAAAGRRRSPALTQTPPSTEPAGDRPRPRPPVTTGGIS